MSTAEKALRVNQVQLDVLRLQPLSDLHVRMIRDNVKEFYFTIHDWISDTLYEKNNDWKSQRYTINKSWDSFISQVNEFARQQRIVTEQIIFDSSYNQDKKDPQAT